MVNHSHIDSSPLAWFILVIGGTVRNNQGIRQLLGFSPSNEISPKHFQLHLSFSGLYSLQQLVVWVAATMNPRREPLSPSLSNWKLLIVIGERSIGERLGEQLGEHAMQFWSLYWKIRMVEFATIEPQLISGSGNSQMRESNYKGCLPASVNNPEVAKEHGIRAWDCIPHQLSNILETGQVWYCLCNP